MKKMTMPSQLDRRINQMAKAKAEPNINYKYACRCCLKSDAEFVNLDTLMVSRNLDPSEASDQIPLIRCLLFCIRAENAPELPYLICIDCSKSLQIAYYFLQNALHAHEILCRKLCPDKLINSHFNSLFTSNFSREKAPTEVTPHVKSGVRHECKICGTIVHNRMELKQHIRLHRDVVSHNCNMCSFVTMKQRLLVEHYSVAHYLTTAQAEERINSENTLTEQRDGKEQEDGKVCTLEDLELLIPTVLRPEDYAQPKIEYDIKNQVVAPSTSKESNGNNISIGTEFLVLPDGSLQQLNGAGVLFEYIDDSNSNVPSTSSLNLQSLLGSDDINIAPMDLDVNELIVEEIPPKIKAKPNSAKIGLSSSHAKFKHKCKHCTKTFPTLARLKSHQLTHSNLPKFHCDQCKFYSLRSSDLAYHYKTIHSKHDNDVKPVGNSRIFSCDLCLFETGIPNILRDHYTDEHMVLPTEVQLRPSWTPEMETMSRNSITPDRSAVTNNLNFRNLLSGHKEETFIPLDIKFPETEIMTHDTITDILQQPQATTTATITPMGDISVVVDAAPLFFGTGTETAVHSSPEPATIPLIVDNNIGESTAVNVNTDFSAFPEISASDSLVSSSVPPMAGMTNENLSELPNQNLPELPNQNLPELTNQNLPVMTNQNLSELPDQNLPAMTNQNLPITPNNSLIFSDMQDFIDNTDVAAICTIPADDMPVVDGDDIVIDNNNISLDFDAENFFEDFDEEDEEVEVAAGENEEEVDELEDDVENDDENDNNDAAADQNLLLTSDDDDVDDFDDEQSKHLQKPYCIYCNKKFTSQYKFENHMFVHRGLAPYRCELCTNLYNMKRLLIRHYKTVHKRMPTRDMVQAKGEKISVARSNKETIQPDDNKNPMLMCAKCPFECESDSEMKKHLNAHHGINDGVSAHANEVFIIRKLPFECPRCIRSFAAKRTLTRHLQRSHLVDTIIELTNAASTTTTSSTVSTTNAEDTGNKQIAVMIAPSMGPEINDDECEPDKPDSDDTVEVEAAEQVSVVDNENKITTTTSTSAAGTTTSTTVAPAASSPTATTASSSSTLFPTPSPFDFDYDFMGDAANSTPSTSTNNNNNSNNNNNNNNNSTAGYTETAADVLPSHILNGSDKLLTGATMEPSPIKNNRSRLPRTPIYVCKLCNKTFDELGKLVKHEAGQHSSSEPRRVAFQHKCSICNSTFRTLTLLKFHMKRHLARRFQCSRCPKSFNRRKEIERHMLSKHERQDGKEESYKCSLDNCKKTFRYKHHMARHQNAVHLKIRHICNLCGEDLKTSFNLRSHMRVHGGNGKSYKCPYCERSYVRRGPLQLHARQAHQVELTESDWPQMLCSNICSNNSPKKKAPARKSQSSAAKRKGDSN